MENLVINTVNKRKIEMVRSKMKQSGVIYTKSLVTIVST